MKRILLMAGIVGLLAACKDAPQADKTEATEAQTVTTTTEGTTYNADLTASTLEWVGTKPTGRHHGTLKIKSGSLIATANALTGGQFVIDVTSLKPDDQDEKGNAKLGTHLLSADFFDAGKYPEARFEITGVVAGVNTTDKDVVMKDATHTVTGNLTLKDVTKSITFPAKITMAENSVTADANFNIDRTQWGIVYGSDKNLGDKMINSEVNIQLHLVANK